ncbi:MAG: hypothetical protein MUQ32_18570, partial [Chloroflexi bacterium]|nr:hypothetical protein [Chloroflexota bacterium]
MSSSEIAFLALGLILGCALGAAFLAAARSRPAPRREVRITIAPNSIGARRAVTLADPLAVRSRPSPPGSPDEAAWSDNVDAAPGTSLIAGPEAPAIASPIRTRVPSAPALLATTAVAVPVVGEFPVTPLGGTSSAMRGNPWRDTVPAPGVAGAAAMAAASGSAFSAQAAGPQPTAVMDLGQPASEWLVRARPPAHGVQPTLAAAAVGFPIASAEEPGADERRAEEPGADETREPSPAAPPSTAPDPVGGTLTAGPCDPAQTAAEERCLEAAGAREQARGAADAVRDARRAIDDLHERIDKAREASDPRFVAATKSELHAAYRKASSAAGTPDEAEEAARHWLKAIDRTNTDARTALRLVETATAELRERLPALERLAAEADAARISAEGAEQECRVAREELARCEELALAAVMTHDAEPEAAETLHPLAAAWPTEPDLAPDRGSPEGSDEDPAGLPVIIRVLRGDRAARERAAAAFAGDDPAGVATWRLRVSALVDAIVARAIEAGFMDLPDDDPFWQL